MASYLSRLTQPVHFCMFQLAGLSTSHARPVAMLTKSPRTLLRLPLHGGLPALLTSNSFPRPALETIRRTCHRRQSSSKTSRPSDLRGTLPSQDQNQSQQQRDQASLTRQGRIGRRRSKSVDPAPVAPEDYQELPSVPSTQHLHPLDVNLSSFFSLHRPISITSPFPQTSDVSAFEKIFDGPSPVDAPLSKQQQYNQLRSVLDALGYFSAQPHASSPNSTTPLSQHTSSDQIIHLDSEPPLPSLEQALSTIPFRAPRAPEPGDEQNQNGPSLPTPDLHSRPKRKDFRATIKRKSWSTTIVVTETTDHHGRKFYRATNSPITQIPVATSQYRSGAAMEEPTITIEHGRDGDAIAWRQPFFQRMWLRHRESVRRRSNRQQLEMPGREREKAEMVLISVKRQRKLKMKKHKHKKLMRRTRNLRRKLGQA